MTNYILDACAILAFLNDEEGSDIVNNLIKKAKNGEISLIMNSVNLIEVYYDRIRIISQNNADAIIKEIYENSLIAIIDVLTPAIVREAAYFKAKGKMSFADAILVATARCTGATIVTCDHIELEIVEQQEHIPFLWIRPKF